MIHFDVAPQKGDIVGDGLYAADLSRGILPSEKHRGQSDIAAQVEQAFDIPRFHPVAMLGKDLIYEHPIVPVLPNAQPGGQPVSYIDLHIFCGPRLGTWEAAGIVTP